MGEHVRFARFLLFCDYYFAAAFVPVYACAEVFGYKADRGVGAVVFDKCRAVKLDFFAVYQCNIGIDCQNYFNIVFLYRYFSFNFHSPSAADTVNGAIAISITHAIALL